MGKVGTGFSVSLDGFIADPQGEVGPLFDWYNSGDNTLKYPGVEWEIKVSAASATVIQEMVNTTGAVVSGRGLFDLTNGWSGSHPVDVPVFVVTHRVPHEWIAAHPDAPFTFVTDGVESAVAQARAVAGDKNVGIGGANVAQQAIKAGLVDEIAVDLVPVLLGGGIRYFDNLGSQPPKLELTSVVEGVGVTHLRYRVVK